MFHAKKSFKQIVFFWKFLKKYYLYADNETLWNKKYIWFHLKVPGLWYKLKVVGWLLQHTLTFFGNPSRTMEIFYNYYVVMTAAYAC